jgi:cytochrome c556
VWLAGSAVLAVGLWFLAAGQAADEKEVRDAILKLADLVEKKDPAGVKKEGEAVAKKHELDEVMYLFKHRTKKGLGVGAKPGAIMPDGIEDKLRDLARRALPQDRLDKEAADLARMGSVTAAIAEVAQYKCTVEKREGDKDPKKWQEFIAEMRQTALDMAEAAKAKKPNEVKATATKLNTNCNNCHGIFRDS